MYNFTCVVLFVFVFIIGFDGYTQQLYEGSKCCNIDSPGVCTRVFNCPIALKSIKTSGRTGLKHCSFVRDEEIVCCPEIDSSHNTCGPTTQSATSQTDDNENKTQMRNPPVSGTRSKKVCDNYGKLPIILTYHIVEGENADVGEFPHMVALGFWNEQDQLYKFDCGGTLISNNYVVTAAHCIVNVEQNQLKLVRMGTVNVPATIENPDPKYDYNVANVTLHREYNWKEKLNDIALVKLEKKVNFTDYIRPACLYTKDDDPENLVVTGWGTLALGGEKSIILQKATLSPVPLEQCNNTYQNRTKKKVVKTQICAANHRSDACQGDSGGPLQKQTNSGVSTIIGVTSYGIGCGSKYPGIYTRIYSYLSWIEEIVWP